MNRSTLILIVTIHIYAAVLISGGTLVCYKLITDPRVRHSASGSIALFSLLANIFILSMGLIAYRRTKKE